MISQNTWDIAEAGRADKSAVGTINRPLQLVGDTWYISGPGRADKSAVSTINRLLLD